MNTLTLQFRKKQDGSATMTCVRADGTCTGQKSSAYFVSHDLCHYAAETTLSLKRAFLWLDCRRLGYYGFRQPLASRAVSSRVSSRPDDGRTLRRDSWFCFRRTAGDC